MRGITRTGTPDTVANPKCRNIITNRGYDARRTVSERRRTIQFCFDRGICAKKSFRFCFLNYLFYKVRALQGFSEQAFFAHIDSVLFGPGAYQRCCRPNQQSSRLNAGRRHITNRHDAGSHILENLFHKPPRRK